MSHKRQSDIVAAAPQVSGVSAAIGQRLIDCRVMIAGLGNIGSFLALLMAPLVGSMRLVDRDVVEPHNAVNQLYGPQTAGCTKVDSIARILTHQAPTLRIEQHAIDLQDLPWGYFADIDVCFGGLDSLWARQVVSERTYSLGIPYVDGGVGKPLLAAVKVLLPGQACIECSWTNRHYRQLATEVPCSGGAKKTARTLSPACAGAAVASLMVAQFIRLFSDSPPSESYEISGDLVTGRFVSSRLRRNQACRFGHETGPREYGLGLDFERATLGDVADRLRTLFGQQDLQLEVRRGIFDQPMFAPSRHVGLEGLLRLGTRRLVDVGLTPRDRFIVRGVGTGVTHLRLDLE